MRSLGQDHLGLLDCVRTLDFVLIEGRCFWRSLSSGGTCRNGCLYTVRLAAFFRIDGRETKEEIG